jgi:hypothetical protein
MRLSRRFRRRAGSNPGNKNEIGAVMGEGYLTRYLDLISLNLTQKVVHFWGGPKDADQIKCAVVQFDIKSGVAASRAFVFDTRAGILLKSVIFWDCFLY